MGNPWDTAVNYATNPYLGMANSYSNTRTANDDNANNNAAIDAQVAANSGPGPRQKDWDTGYARGRDIFYNDPDMQAMRARREDLSKGYNGAELGSLRENARQDLEGQRARVLSGLRSQAGRGGVGGARAAAMEGAANQGFAGQRATNERAMNMDQAKMVRQGTGDFQDFLMRQKYGSVATGISEQQQGVADRTQANQAALANKQPDETMLSGMWNSTFGKKGMNLA